MCHLLELARCDVELAVKESKINAEEFLRVVDDCDLAHLANRPLTLNMLLRALKEGKYKSTRNIFWNGVASLVSEPDELRESRGAPRALTTKQRVEVASRFAVLSILSNRPTFGEADIEFINNIESRTNDVRSIDVNAFREVMSSGLFDAEQPGCFRFSHRSFAEYLAAEFLSRTIDDDERLFRMLTVPRRSGRRVPTGLRETASWVAVMNSGVFDRFLAEEPDVLLLTDTASLSPKQKSRLIERYLDLIAEGKMSDERCRSVEASYRRLHYPGLDDQLRRIFESKDSVQAAREVAIEITGDCGSGDSAGALVDLILDEQEPDRLRIAAAYGLRWLCRRHSETIRSELNRLKPLVTGQVHGDKHQELLGNALHCLWPRSLSAKELFDALKPEARHNFHGSYTSFLASPGLVEGLTAIDLECALNWVEKQPPNVTHRHSSTEDVVAAVLHFAWLHITEQGVAERLVPIVIARLEHNEPVFYPLESGRLGKENEKAAEILDSDPEKRKLLLAACAHCLAMDTEHTDSNLYSVSLRLARRSDLGWILDHALSGSDKGKEIWTAIANIVFNQIPLDTMSEEEQRVTIDALRHERRPAELLANLDPVELDSQKEDELREHHRKMKQFGRPPKKKERPTHTLRQIMESWVRASSEENHAEAWRTIHQILIFGRSWDEPETEGFGTGAAVDQSPMWKSADKKLRLRMIDSAKLFVQKTSPNVAPGIDEAKWDGSMWQSYEALRLLLVNERDFLADQPTEWWDRWAQLVVAFPEDRCDEVDKELAAIAYQKAPEVCRRIAHDVLHGAKGVDRTDRRIQRFASCADSAFLDVIERFLLDVGPHGPDQLNTLLSMVVDIDADRSKRIAEVFLSRNLDDNARTLSLATAHVLLADAPHWGWKLVEPLLRADAHWGRDLMGKVAHWRSERARSFIEKIEDAALGRLVLWLYNDMPLGPLPEHNKRAYRPTLEDELWRWRSRVTDYMVEKRHGDEITKALLDLCKSNPDNEWFRECLLRVEDRQIVEAWRPLEPAALVTIVNDPAKRGVTSEAELAAAVTESLQRFEDRLQRQKMPLRDNLWNFPSDGDKKPKLKGEEHFSDNLCDHLSHDLKHVIANREVQIEKNRKHSDDEQGKRLDILVEAIDGNGGRLGVVVEVKIDTNRNVISDLEQQLGERYLDEQRWDQGIYCVAWTGTKQNKWATKDDLDDALQQAKKNCEAHHPGLDIQVLAVDCSLHRVRSEPDACAAHR